MGEPTICLVFSRADALRLRALAVGPPSTATGCGTGGGPSEQE